MSRFSSVAAFAAVLAISSIASAQGDLVANKAEADRLFNEGLVAMGAKDFAKSRDKFAAAFAKHPAPASLLNLAISEKELGQYVQALGHYRTFIGLPDTEIVVQGRPTAKAGIEDCNARICRIEVRAPAGTTVRLDTAAPKTQGSVVDVLETLPGEHTVDLRGKEGARVRKLTCAAGAVVSVEYAEKGISAPPPVTEEARPTAGYVVPGVLLGAGLVGVGLGIGFGVASRGTTDDGEALIRSDACRSQSSATCGVARDKVDTSKSQQTLSIVSYVAGGTLAAAGVVSFLLWPKQTRERAVRVTPTVGGILVTGSF
jgi:tetratricopeptide (TPR) repeat protein